MEETTPEVVAPTPVVEETVATEQEAQPTIDEVATLLAEVTPE